MNSSNNLYKQVIAQAQDALGYCGNRRYPKGYRKMYTAPRKNTGGLVGGRQIKFWDIGDNFDLTSFNNALAFAGVVGRLSSFKGRVSVNLYLA